MARLDFDAVTKVYPGPVSAIDRFTLAVSEGELAVLVGPSGAGKTTALRIAAGLERATSGSIRLDGERIDDWRPKDRDMSMVFQEPSLYPHLSVRKNAGFALRMRHAPREEIDRRVARVAEELGIAHLLDRYPDTLSGGEAQRSSLARALVRRPKVLLLDEPFASLDAPLRDQLRRAFRAAQKSEPVTTVFVTHDQDEALALADRLVVLRNGNIEQVGTAQEVYDRPANRFVAGFLGSPTMNFLEGRLAHQADRLWFEQSGVRLNVAAKLQAAFVEYAGKQVVLGLRPEAISLADRDEGANGAQLKAIVTEREFQGDRWLVRFKTESDAMLTILLYNDPPSAGDNRLLRLDVERIHYFAADAPGRAL
jgi:multiple sugar transport system ATP-binding protein